MAAFFFITFGAAAFMAFIALAISPGTAASTSFQVHAASCSVIMAKAMKAMMAAAPKVMKKKAAMKAMKAAMKVMKKKSVSKIARGVMAKVMVLRGSKAKTVGGLTSKDLYKNKNGRVVSKKLSAKGKKSPWIQACQKARKALKITGFTAIKKGTPLYVKAKEFYGN